MTRINLLDWRSERRERRKKEFFGLLGLAVVAAVAVVVVVVLGLGAAVNNQQARNHYLKQQIADIDKQIKQIKALDKLRDDLLSHMQVIEHLQQSRAATVHFFDEIVSTLPDGVYLTSLEQQENNVTLKGVAQSNGRVSAYIKNLDASPWFANPRLVVITTSEQNHQHRSDFTLEVKNLTASAPEGKP